MIGVRYCVHAPSALAPSGGSHRPRPIEVLVISFPGSQFNGGIIAELERLVGNDTISIIEGLLVTKDDERLARVMDQLDA